MIKNQMLTMGYQNEVVEALLFKNYNWKLITCLQEATQAVLDPMKHDYEESETEIICTIC